MANLTADGRLSLFGLYTEANDIPAQRQVLADLYTATAGLWWTAAIYHNTVFLEAAAGLKYITDSDNTLASKMHCLGADLQQDWIHIAVACRCDHCSTSYFCERHVAQGSMVHTWLQLLSLVGG